jgi:hypothetical protein
MCLYSLQIKGDSNNNKIFIKDLRYNATRRNVAPTHHTSHSHFGDSLVNFITLLQVKYSKA